MNISYTFIFNNGQSKHFDLQFDSTSFLLASEAIQPRLHPWMDLQYHQCPDCTLSAEQYAQCPIAVNLGGIVEPFENQLAIASVTTEVSIRDRKVTKECDLQEGLSSLMGLVMATSGCPILDNLRPMAYMHQPFSGSDETLFRAATVFLMAQYIKQKNGQKPTYDLKELTLLFNKINNLNEAFSARLDDHFQHDNINSNALTLLGMFTVSEPFDLEFVWEKQVTPLFSAFLE